MNQSVVVAAVAGDHVSARITRGLAQEAAGLLGARDVPASLGPWGGRVAGRLAASRAGRALVAGAARDGDVIAIAMGPDALRFAAREVLAARGRRTAVCFDTWPSRYNATVALSRRLGLEVIAVSSQRAASDLTELDPSRRWIWLPEGLPHAHVVEPSDPEVDVVEFGRRWAPYHDAITPALASAGRSHVYQPDAPQPRLAIADDATFLDTLARARVSICFPRSVSDPVATDGLSTMTLRYLQSMVAGCLIVGSSPPEMVELFGYDPVVAADRSDPAGQLLDLLDHLEDHAALVERNRREVLARHCWEHRVARLRSETG